MGVNTKMRKVRRLLAMATVATTLTATTLTGCGTAEELMTDETLEEVETIVDDILETGKKVVVLADTVKDENAEVGVVQSKENIEAETDVEQAYDDFLQEQDAAKLESEEFTVVPFQTTFYVSSDTNVYEKPDNTSAVLGQVTLNTEIVTTGRVEEVDWYKFQLDGKEVYISKSFLSEEKLELEVVKEPEKTKEEYQQAANDFKEQVKQQQANTTNPFAGGFGPSAGDGSNWDDGFVPSGRDIIVH